MPVLALIFVAYALAGPHLPLAIAHRGYSLQRICKFLATDLDGLFGTTMSVSATVIFMFVTVSYTHLDVYKRQGVLRAGRPKEASDPIRAAPQNAEPAYSPP